MGEYRLTPAAKSDLINIWNYTSGSTPFLWKNLSRNFL
jgi:plasmid stabilization system protein ParE